MDTQETGPIRWCHVDGLMEVSRVAAELRQCSKQTSRVALGRCCSAAAPARRPLPMATSAGACLAVSHYACRDGGEVVEGLASSTIGSHLCNLASMLTTLLGDGSVSEGAIF